MKRFWILPVIVPALAALAWADGSAPPSVDAMRVQQLQRNRPLVKVLVAGGLRLASEDDALKRAGYCYELAQSFAGEIQEAATEKDGARAAELGQYLRLLLKQGVAGNLSTAQSKIPNGSTRESEFREVGERVTKLTQPIVDQLRQVVDNDPEEIRATLRAVYDGRAAVDRALKLPDGSKD